jgi:HEAT repeat protein
MVRPGEEQDTKPDRERELAEREAQRARAERDRENSLYEQATNALYEGRYDRALNNFSRLAETKSTRADAALYWKAYSQNRLGQRAEALTTIGDLTKTYPNSQYLKQARALEVEVRAQAGQPVRPDAQADDELKLIALNGLAQSNAPEAVPLIENLLNGTASPRVKSQALFVLAQVNNPKAREVLRNVAKGSSIPELQLRAIQYLGVHGGAENRAMLAEIYTSSSDVDVKRRILRAFMQAGDRDRVFAAAQNEKTPELRIEAVRQLGNMGASEMLWPMYQKETAPEVKRQIISALQVSGNATRMIELAKSEKDPELRRLAIRNLGVMGSKAAGDTLVELYNTETDLSNRRTIINALHSQDNAVALVALARKEQEPTLKRDIVQRLSTMDNKEARAYMLELLK